MQLCSLCIFTADRFTRFLNISRTADKLVLSYKDTVSLSSVYTTADRGPLYSARALYAKLQEQGVTHLNSMQRGKRDNNELRVKYYDIMICFRTIRDLMQFTI